MHWGFGDWWGYGMGYGFHWIFMILFWGLLIWVIVMLVRGFGGSARSGGSERSALQILEERYARGELDDKEFEEKRAKLQ
jgi:putative membrane protein